MSSHVTAVPLEVGSTPRVLTICPNTSPFPVSPFSSATRTRGKRRHTVGGVGDAAKGDPPRGFSFWTSLGEYLSFPRTTLPQRD